MDVINHFTDPKRKYPVRNHIARRFGQALDLALANPNARRLVIIAHSQGTVITLEAFLRKLWDEKLKGRLDSLTILTFGSPWTHIYQHYFPDEYPAAAGDALISLAKEPRVRWLNIFRIDDAIGTEVTVALDGFPMRVPGMFGGHARYWTEDILGAAALAGLLPSATKAAS